MSRQSHLPPRCPFQMKSTTLPSHNFVSSSSSNDHFTPRHQKSVSQSFVLEEQPPWLDDILNETNANSKISPLRRSVSDSVTLLSTNESGNGLETSCVYGPNSPRSRGSMALLEENNVVSKLKIYFSRTPTLYPDSSLAEIVRPNMIRDEGGSAEVANVETRAIKRLRHSGQRSRVRKLQHIAELERTVEFLQSLESELATKVASLLQLRVALSMENNTLKQQLAGLQQDKMFLDGEYRSLKTELEMLKSHVAYSAKRNHSIDLKSSSVKEEVPSLENVWEMLDIGKLDLNK